MTRKTYYITTPIYYPSDKLHLGHCYTTVAADAMARFKRFTGHDVWFLTGTDEHGQKIQRKAEEKGITPQAYVDGIVDGIKKLWDRLEISYDDFIRTTDKRHEEVVQRIFQDLYNKGDIYKSQYEGWYCTPCESFWTEKQLIDGNCPDCNRKVELTKEESYFFKLSKYQDRLLKYFEENPNFLRPESRMNEMINNFLKPGLEDLCVSRTSFDWGVKVPFDQKHVIYVWFDAVCNYISALGFMTEDNSLYKKFWPANVHLVGKEIVRFHTIVWPAILMALDIPLPDQVFGHGWILLEGGKMSKSKGNVIDPIILSDRYGIDAIKYFLLREYSFSQDGVYSEETLVNRINADLANDLGNLISRTITMIEKYNGGVIPQPKEGTDFDESLRNLAVSIAPKVEEHMDKLQFNNSLSEIWKLVSRTNKYIDETSPWVLAKDDANKGKLDTVLYNLAECIRIISILIYPFMAKTTNNIWTQLGITLGQGTQWDDTKVYGRLSPGVKVSKGTVLFPRVELVKEEEKVEEVKKEMSTKEENTNYITIDDFAKVELRVAKVIKAERVEKADKLLKLQLKIGEEVRQVVSGIAKHYSPEELIGKSVIVVANLKPVNLRGEESRGMILAASNDNGLVLVGLDKEIEDGAIVK